MRQQPAVSSDKDAFQAFVSLQIQHVPCIGTKHITPHRHTFRNIYLPHKSLIASKQTNTLHDKPVRPQQFYIHITAEAVWLMRDGIHQKNTEMDALPCLIAVSISTDIRLFLREEPDLPENAVQEHIVRLGVQGRLGKYEQGCEKQFSHITRHQLVPSRP